MSSSILIIGAGAAGLMAARDLAASGFSVTVVEAAAIPGGRIYTANIPHFTYPLEAGAEFVHGDLPLTLELAREAGIPLVRTNYEQMGPDDPQASGPAYWDELMDAMGKLSHDMPVAEFLATYFGGDKYAGLRESVRGYAEGYDLADLTTVSTKSLHAEWAGEEDNAGYRPEGGYGRMVDFLVRECSRLGVLLKFSSLVTEIRWQAGRVEAITAAGGRFSGESVLVTVSLGVLSQLVFSPAIPDYMEAAHRIGYGSVIKILLEFRTAFWLRRKRAGSTMFILSRQPVPTWWTQTADISKVLTGWVTAENMRRLRTLDDKEKLELCLASLAKIFSLDAAFLRKELTAFAIFDWAGQPFVRGGYSFETVTTPEARRVLRAPLADTLYFAGEALHEGQAPGTVEAALQSGLDAAGKIIARHKPRY